VAEGSGRQLTEFGIRVSFTQEALLSSERSKGFFNGLSRPWPGRLPSPSPAAVFSTPKPLEVFDVGGKPVQVSGRGNVTGQPATLVGMGDKARSVINWAGPWPVEEHWWDLDKHYRQARFQFVLDDGSAHLCVVERSRWWLQATYS
jgi:protein ImuB